MTTGCLAHLEAPEAWEWHRLDRVAERRQDCGRADLQSLSVFLGVGVVPRSERDDNHNRLGEDLSKYLVVRQGDVVFNKLRTWQGGFGVSRYEGIVSPAYFVMRPGSRMHPRFLNYLLLSAPYIAELTRRSKWMPPSQFDIPWEQLRTLPVLVAPREEQCRIVEFLDRRTKAIDMMILEKERLARLLEERRQAAIGNAITGGLDGSRSIMHSGHEELGYVPEGWSVVPLKRRWSIVDCKHRTVPFVEQGIPLASIGEVQGFEVDLSTAKRTTREEYLNLVDGARRPKRGDIIFSRNATVGAAALVATEEEFAMGQDVCLIRSTHESQRFLLFQLKSHVVARQLDAVMVGATFKRVNISQIADLVVCCPPRAVQDRIARYCDEVSNLTGMLTGRLTEQLDSLREYRRALISSAVTGKIDVSSMEAA